MTWNEYQHQVNHFLLREWREWDRTRRIACESYNQMNEKPIDYTKYMPLPTDPDPRKINAKKLADELDFLEEMKQRGRI